MPQDRKTGTAWDRSLSDYAYTRGLSGPGWAWEFLRRNEAYQHDARLNRAGHPIAIRHVSGAQLYRLRRRFVAAENWGLSFFADPSRTGLDVTPLWLPNLLTRVTQCEAHRPQETHEETISLADFDAYRAILASPYLEQIAFRAGFKAADLVVTKGSFMFGKRAVAFRHVGLKSASRHAETLKILNQMSPRSSPKSPPAIDFDTKYRDYLAALDGHLEGRSHREISEVLYGRERVIASWRTDSLGLKSKVRRAIDCGSSLMNGGYRDLL